MKHSNTANNNVKKEIDAVDITSDVITGRGGIIFFVRYLKNIGIYPYIETLFSFIRRSNKGKPVVEIFKQLFCFFMDGTSRHITYFDALKEDGGYSASIESSQKDMLSSHAVKRFFKSFLWGHTWLFRRVLKWLFIWRLKIEEPSIIILGLDTVVMNNDEANNREGVKPTYKKVKGFQPLVLSWGRFVIDAIFRNGSKHSNYGDGAIRIVFSMIKLIRKHYREDVPIIIRVDGGFFDQGFFRVLEEIGIGYIAGGRFYDDIKSYISGFDKGVWGCLDKGEQKWDFVEFGDRRENWDKFRRAIYCRPVYEDKQQLLEFARPETVLYTNIGMGSRIDDLLYKAEKCDMIKTEELIKTYHGRGNDELVNRAIKEFASETLPFENFHSNAAFYYTMLLAFFLFETFKEDILKPVIPITAYATTIRRKVIDIAAKIVHHSGKIILKVTKSVWEHLRIQELWQRSAMPPVFAWG